MTSSAVELAAYEPAQREDYLRLLRQAWGDDTLSGDEFDWWFTRNPAGSLMSVARDDGRVIGVASHSLYRMMLRAEERLASFSVHATTDPAGFPPNHQSNSAGVSARSPQAASSRRR